MHRTLVVLGYQRDVPLGRMRKADVVGQGADVLAPDHDPGYLRSAVALISIEGSDSPSSTSL